MTELLRHRLYPMVFAVLASAAIAFADSDCEPERNDRGNRCEGLVALPVSRPDLVLLSFAGYREPFEDDVDLKVKFFLAHDANVVIRGRDLRDRQQYWM